ncbi:hypothetical protein [Streptomyces sp. NPDC049555]|uniref:hypothetical protein n=1 Tax=Streptomyces sp. NPDC049555 TaxID=3154930 RepID=UPI003413DAB3
MSTAPAIVDAYEVLGFEAPECCECEDGTLFYCDGPYERTRECETCRGTGRFLVCPQCIDGLAAGADCLTCDGAGTLH